MKRRCPLASAVAWDCFLLCAGIPSHLLQATNLRCRADLQVCQERRKKRRSASSPHPTALLRLAQALRFWEMRSCQDFLYEVWLLEACLQGRAVLRAAAKVRLVPTVPRWMSELGSRFQSSQGPLPFLSLPRYKRAGALWFPPAG